MGEKAAGAHMEVSRVLNELSELFTADCMLTFIMRKPGDDEADMLISNDDLGELQKLVNRCRSRPSGTKR